MKYNKFIIRTELQMNQYFKSDTNPTLQMKQWGIDCILKFIGMFA